MSKKFNDDQGKAERSRRDVVDLFRSSLIKNIVSNKATAEAVFFPQGVSHKKTTVKKAIGFSKIRNTLNLKNKALFAYTLHKTT